MHNLHFKQRRFNNIAYICSVFVIIILLSTFNFQLSTNDAHAAINEQINYQGKLTDIDNIAVPDGDYDMRFRLCTDADCNTVVWTETWNSSSSQVPVLNGLFSVMLGTHESLGSINFNQTLYLGVRIGTDTEMTPRKTLGSVPAAFNSKQLGGYEESAFALLQGRSGGQNLIGGSDADDTLTLQGNSATGNTDTNVSIQFNVGDSGSLTAMNILNNGLIGIGLANPTEALHVNGSVLLENGNAFAINSDSVGPLNVAFVDAATNYITYGDGNAASLQFVTGGTGGSVSMIIDNGGNIGIGTLSPTTLLQIGDSGTTAGTLSIAGDTSGLVTLQTNSAAGTYSLTLPDNDGDPDQVLSTDGSGILSWITMGGGAGGGAQPIGAVVAYGGDTSGVPSDYIICDGRAISRDDYADLFAVIGTSFGVGDGSTTFNVPDLRGRFALGADNMGGTSANRVTSAQADTIGGSSGSESHTLTVDELASHSHLEQLYNTGSSTTDTYVNPNVAGSTAGSYINTVSGGINRATISTASTGSGTAFNIMNPYQTVNYIIKATTTSDGNLWAENATENYLYPVTDGRKIRVTDSTGAEFLELAHDGTDAKLDFSSGTGLFNIDSDTLVIDVANDAVGIGTTTPSNKFSVDGNANFTGHIAVGNNAIVNNNNVPTGVMISDSISEDMSAYNWYDGIGIYNEYDNTGSLSGYVYGIDNNLTISSLSVGDFGSFDGSDAFLYNYGSGDIGTMSGQYNYIDHSGTGYIGYINGTDNEIFVNDGTAGFINSFYSNTGIYAEVNTVNAYYGFTDISAVADTVNSFYGYSSINAAVDTYNGIYLGLDTSDTVGIANGLYIENFTQANVTNGWNIYSEGVDSRNYFGGNVSIGTTDTDFLLTVGGNIGPNADATYDLGSDSNRFKDLYVSGDSIHMGSTGNEGCFRYNSTTNKMQYSNDCITYSDIGTGSGGDVKQLVRNFTAASGESISAGDVVSFVNGEVKKGISSIGTETAFHSANTEYLSAVALDNTRFVVTYRDPGNSNYGKAIVGTVSGNSISWGSEYNFNSGATTYTAVSKIDTDKIVISFATTGTSYIYSIVGTISGSVISYGSAVGAATGSASNYISNSALSTTKFVKCTTYGATPSLSCWVGSVSGNVITFGTKADKSAGAANRMLSNSAVAAMSDSTFVVATNIDGMTYGGTAYLGTVSGTTITYNTGTTFQEYDSGSVSVKKLDSNNFVIAYNGTDYPMPTAQSRAVLGTVTPTSLSISGPYYFAGAGSYYSISTISPSEFVIAFKDSTNNNYGTMVTGNVSNGGLVFGNKTVYNTGDSIYNQIVMLDQYKYAISYSDVGNSGYGTSIVGNIYPELGVAKEAISGGSSGLVVFEGVTDGHTGLTVGVNYYANADGTLTTTANSNLIGTAVSATEILLSSSGLQGGMGGSGTSGGYWLDNSTSSYLYPYLNGRSLRVFDSGGTDYIDMAHNGTDALLTFANTSSLKISTNVLPSADDTYSLGSATNRWSDLYLGPDSVKEYNLYTDASNYELGKLGFTSNVLTVSTSAAGSGTERPIQIKTGSTYAGLYLNTSGNIGIGTTTPNARLTVEGVTSFAETTAPTQTSGYGKMYVKSSDSKLYFMNDSGTEYDLTTGGGGTNYWTASGNNIYNNNSGNVGIGTATPGLPLELVNSGVQVGSTNYYVNSYFRSSAGNGLSFGHDNTGNVGIISSYLGSGGDVAFWGLKDGVWGERMRITSPGKVGIGTATPGYYAQVDIRGNGQGTGYLSVTETVDTNIGILLNRSGGPVGGWNSPGGSWSIYRYGSSGGDRFAIGVANVQEAFSIDYSGNTGLGYNGTLTSFNERLSISGRLSLQETTAPSASSGYGKLYVDSSNSSLYFMNDSGTAYNLLVGTGPGGSNGQVQFNSSGAFGADSGFVWDNTNKRLGINDSGSYSRLQVGGGIGIGYGGNISATDGANNTLQITTDTYYGGVYDNYPGMMLFSTMGSGWGLTSLGFKAASGWNSYYSEDAATIGYMESTFRKKLTVQTSADEQIYLNIKKSGQEYFIGNDFYNDGSDSFFIYDAVDGKEILYTDTNLNTYIPGNLGLGLRYHQTAPNNPLEVYSNNAGSVTSQIHVTAYASSNNLGGWITSGMANSSLLLSAGGELVNNSWIARDTSAALINNYGSGLAFYTASGLTTGNSFSWGNQKMTLNTSGYLGIGTITPQKPLEVYLESDSGALRLSRGVSTYVDLFTNSQQYLEVLTTATPGGAGNPSRSALRISTTASSSYYTDFKLNPLGGLDIASQSGKVSINWGTSDYTNGYLNVRATPDDTTSSHLRMWATSGMNQAFTDMRATYTGDLVFTSNRMNEGIRVGINGEPNSTFSLQTAGHIGPMTDDTYDLGSNAYRWRDVYVGPGTIHVGTSTSDEYTIGYDTTNNLMDFKVNGSSTKMVMNSSGNLGLGTTNPSDFILQAAGHVGPETNNTYDLGSATKRWRNIYANNNLYIDGNTYINNNLYYPNMTEGSVIFAGASGLLTQDNAHFFFNNTTDKLSVSTSYSSGIAISGISDTGIGLYGYGNMAGVKGEASGAGSYGVWGVGNTGNYGVLGYGGYGVVGSATGESSIAVYGVNNDTHTASYGVYGNNTGGAGYGVYGMSASIGTYGGGGLTGVRGDGSNYGVYGYSTSGEGVFGYSGVTVGVHGNGTTYGTYGTASSSSGYGAAGIAGASGAIGVLAVNSYTNGYGLEVSAGNGMLIKDSYSSTLIPGNFHIFPSDEPTYYDEEFVMQLMSGDDRSSIFIGPDGSSIKGRAQIGAARIELITDDSSGNNYISGVFTNGGVNFPNIGSGTGTSLVVDGSGNVLKDSSSSRYKENINPLEVDSSKIYDLQPVSFNFISQPDIKTFGLIAEEVNEVIPELVNFDAAGQAESVRYQYLSVLLLNEMKKNKTTLDVLPSLQEKITNIETTLSTLSEKVSHLDIIDDVITIKKLKVTESTEFEGKLIVKSQVVFNQDTVGQAKILAGDTEVEVKFNKEYEYQPIVSITQVTGLDDNEDIMDIMDVKSIVKDVTTKGFKIFIKPEQLQDIIFNWNAFGSDEGKIFISDGKKEDIKVEKGE